MKAKDRAVRDSSGQMGNGAKQPKDVNHWYKTGAQPVYAESLVWRR